MVDLLIRDARVIDVFTDQVMDVAVQEGKIVATGMQLPYNTDTIINADGLVLMPGGIDPHVHFNEPGRANWEGFETGSKALAKGGMTTFFDMPLNSTPPTTTVSDFEIKRQIADEMSVCNAYLWGGLIPGNLDQIAGLAQSGVIGFKAFMSTSGIEDFPAVDDYTLYRGMEIIAAHDKVLAVHAESDNLTQQLSHHARAEAKTAIKDYLASRPIIAELEAIQRAILFAKETGCKLHVVHISSGRGVELVNEARQNGVDVSCETCPHYLTLTDEDVNRIGAEAKCAPPIRTSEEQEALWDHLIADKIKIIASDHSPAPLELKQSDDFFAVWGGISSCQSTLSLMLTYGYHQRGMSLQQIAGTLSYNTAQRFGLTNKGRIYVGADADLTLVDIDAQYTLRADDLAYKHRISPYIGMTLRGQVKHTWVGGKLVYG